MAEYYVNKNAQANGDHEVHVYSCFYLPDSSNCLYLGNFSNCYDAVREAKKHINKVTDVIIVRENAIRANILFF